jgi:AcrR family transcriptional regulator
VSDQVQSWRQDAEPPGPDDEVEVDGRTARRDRNRLAVLDAVVELFTEDNLQPRPEDVARRSGVSLRSVYRYYSDPDDLIRAAIERHVQSVLPLLRIHDFGKGAFDDRVRHFVAGRLRLYEALAPAARAARIAAARNDIILERVELTRGVLRRQLEAQFAPELAALDERERDVVATAADVSCQLEAIDFHRVHGGLTVAATAAVLELSLTKLLS